MVEDHLDGILAYCDKKVSLGYVESVLIRLSHTPTIGSMLSICISLGQSWRSTCLSETICRFRGCFRNSSACFRVKRRALPILSALGGAPDSSALTAGLPANRIVFSSRPGVLRCRKCRRDTHLTAGTVMERTHTPPLSVWFWAAYLVASQTPGMSAVQFQRQLGLSRDETAFQLLHKLRAGMVRPGSALIQICPQPSVPMSSRH